MHMDVKPLQILILPILIRHPFSSSLDRPPTPWHLNKQLFLPLADAYGCKIVSNSDTTYSCTPDNSSAKYEIHVLAVYEASGTANVNMNSRGESNRPIILVLVSYEPVNWVLNIPPDIIINTVILVSTKHVKEVSQFLCGHSYLKFLKMLTNKWQ
jgi:hypothetical protein